VATTVHKGITFHLCGCIGRRVNFEEVQEKGSLQSWHAVGGIEPRCPLHGVGSFLFYGTKVTAAVHSGLIVYLRTRIDGRKISEGQEKDEQPRCPPYLE
jgi:hypothetical protein